MKRIINLLVVATMCTLSVTGCYDATLCSDLSELDSRLTNLENQMFEANQTIGTLQELVLNLNKKLFVNSVKQTGNDYVLSFSDGSTVTIKDSASPEIGVKKDSDGTYYWTLNGEWLLDSNGAKINASAADGITPQLKIEGGYWYISYDNGKSWSKLDKAKGEDGDSFFKSVTWDDNFVYITFQDNTSVTFSRGLNGVKAITAVPDYSDGSVKASLEPFTLRFDVVPAAAAASLAAISPDYYQLNIAYTITKAAAGDRLQLPIKSIESADGQLLVTADGTSLDYQLEYEVFGASASLNICELNNGITSGYFPLRFKSRVIKVYAGDNLQNAIDKAETPAEVRVVGGAVFQGPIYLKDRIKLSGGWNHSFTEQDLNNRSVIDGHYSHCCLYSGIDANNHREDTEDVTVSGFEIRNGGKSGIYFHGRLAVEYCWIHNCFSSGRGGGIQFSEYSRDDLLLANSILEYNKADGHGGALFGGGSNSRMVVVNCLFRGNASIAQYGYTAAIHGQSGVQAYLINNTIVHNVNWRDGSSATSTPWSAVYFRNNGTHIEMVNNIVAGNYYFLPGVANDWENYPDRYEMPIKPMFIMEMQEASIDLSVIGSYDMDYVCRSNLLGGSDPNRFIYRAGTDEARDAAQAACTFVPNWEFDTIFVDAENGDFRPAGPALNVGESSEFVLEALKNYPTDLAGKPRSTNGVIYAGCYQP